MTPAQYANRYRSIPIFHNNDSRDVVVEIYRIGDPDKEQGELWQALKEHFAAKKKKDPGYTLQLRVNSGTATFSSHQEMLRSMVNPFWGKGSPEDCQIALEVAVLLDRIKLNGVKEYAKNHIGLDCNGFVGNYLWHEQLNNDWNVHPQSKADPGPSALITTIMNHVGSNGKWINDLSELKKENKYVMAELDGNYRIKPGGSEANVGHIVITEPNRFMAKSFIWDSFGSLDLNLAKQDIYGHPAYYAVESTGPENSVGLRESWYAFRQEKNGKGNPVPGVFNIFRGSKGTAMKMRIAQVEK